MSHWLRGIALALVAANSWTACAAEAWRVVDTAGNVRIGGTGFQPVALTRDQDLPKDAWVETANNGRVVLVRGLETIVVEPNSRVQLPAAEVNGNTQVLQFLGSAIYKVGKQAKPHFQVDTPYLAAVVKGTSFTVTVNDGAATVEVAEGLVEVATPDQSDTEFVRPGFTAVVAREHSSDVVVDPTPKKDEPATLELPGEKSAKGESDSTSVITIAEPIGEVEVNVKEVSGGLVTADAPVLEVVEVKADDKVKGAGEDPASDGSNGSGNGNGNGGRGASDVVDLGPADPGGGPVVEDTPVLDDSIVGGKIDASVDQSSGIGNDLREHVGLGNSSSFIPPGQLKKNGS